MNPVTADRRHYEDLAEGEVIALGRTTVTKDMIISFAREMIALGRTTVTKDMIISFAREFDPFPFHLDEKAAKESLLGGLAASGWQTAALSLRLLVDAFLGKVDSQGSLGFSDLKWRRPVMVDDTIGGEARIVSMRRSNHHPERGVVTIAFDIRNQKGEPVMTMNLVNLIGLRDPSAPMPQAAA